MNDADYIARARELATIAELHPGRIVDRTCRGSWVRDYRSDRRFFMFRYYWRGVRVPWIAWAMFS